MDVSSHLLIDRNEISEIINYGRHELEEEEEVKGNKGEEYIIDAQTKLNEGKFDENNISQVSE